MTLDQIVQHVIDNREGGTVSAYGAGAPSFGYWVGGAGPCLVIPGPGLLDSAGLIRDFLNRCSAAYFGWWTDSDDGKFYLDCVTWVADVDKASRLASERGEIAFWDIASDAEIRTEA